MYLDPFTLKLIVKRLNLTQEGGIFQIFFLQFSTAAIHCQNLQQLAISNPTAFSFHHSTSMHIRDCLGGHERFGLNFSRYLFCASAIAV